MTIEGWYTVVAGGISRFGQSRRESRTKNVAVVAAKERVGGRVRTESVRGHPFDHGAQWLHGRQRNRLYELAQRRDLLAHGQVGTRPAINP